MDNKGQTNILGAAVGAIVGVIAILVFASIYDAIPKSNISSGAESLLNIVDLVLAAVVILGILIGALMLRRP